MEPRNYALANLFENQGIYVVPRYQRLYVWNQEDQWEPLWEDVIEIAGDLLNEATNRNSEEVNADSRESHFLGAVVLKQSGFTPDMAQRWRVIDGQQRLTTVQLLMTAVADELDKIELSVQAERLRKLTKNSADEPFKIIHGGQNYKRFRDVMEANGEESVIEAIESPMADCYKYFRNVAHQWFDGQISRILLAASALIAVLIAKLRVVAIYLDSHEKEHMIFETLNARGEPLTEWDKIKNYLLYKADEDSGVDQDSFFDKYLEMFDDDWWRGQIGRGQRPRTDIFADYWLESRVMSPVSTRRVFRMFQKHVDDVKDSLDDLGQDIIQDAKYYQKFEQRDDYEQTYERQFHNRRMSLEVGAMWPLLLQLQRVECKQREQAFACLESYWVRRLIAGYQARSYDQVTLYLLHTLNEFKKFKKDGDVIMHSLQHYKERGTVWPSDNEVRSAILERRLSSSAQNIVLHAIEKHLMPESAPNPTVYRNVQVEHLMPQSWKNEHWQLSPLEEVEDVTEERNRLIHTLGNLTLVNSRLNASMSNGPWHRKREAIKESDNLFINRKLLDDASDVWDEEQIIKRGKWMADIILNIWPREA